MRNFWTNLCLAGMLLVAISCSGDVETASPEVSHGLRITTSLRSIHSRTAGGETMSDEKGFGENDVVGLFSSGGNLEEGSDGKLVNIPMKFDYSKGDNGYVFVNEDVEVDVSKMGEVYLYYPYREGIETEEGASVVDDNGRVFDFLAATDDWGQGYAFYHSFCRLKIKCGEGFDNVPVDKVPEGQKITVYLNKPADKMRIIDNPRENGENKAFELFGEKKDFESWEESGAYTVILPCFETYYLGATYSTYYIKVDYITLYDNEGTLQTLHLPHDLFEVMDDSGNLVHDAWGALKPNRIFQFTVQMENLKPVVRGMDILAWDKYEDIAESREYGINEVKDFEEWANQYNSFVKEYSSTDRPTSDVIVNHEEYKNLLKYGQYVNKRWNFYLRADIDLSSLGNQGKSSSAYIVNLCDTLSGANHTLSNILLRSDNGNTGFIGTISDGGYVQDIRFSSFVANNSATSGVLCGTIAAQITGGTVTNCRVAGVSLRCASEVFAGAFAGEMTGGTVEHCTFQGAIMGGKSEATGTYAKITGKNPPVGSPQPTVHDVDVANMIVNN